MRGLIQTVSLFPIGSCVTFGEDMFGKVLRKNLVHYDRPVVEIWSAKDPSKRRVIVDLASATDWPSPRPAVHGKA